jgi:hypothetical protein
VSERARSRSVDSRPLPLPLRLPSPFSVWLRAVVVVGVLAGCARTPPPPVVGPGEEPAPIAAAPAAPPPPPVPACTAFARPGVLRRSAVVRAVDAGLGAWLAGVDVTASLAGGRFRGWIVKRLYPGDPCYREVDVLVGDLVTRVNGKSVERPEQATEVLASLRSAPAVVVDLLRRGQPRTVTLAISDE